MRTDGTWRQGFSAGQVLALRVFKGYILFMSNQYVRRFLSSIYPTAVFLCILIAAEVLLRGLSEKDFSFATEFDHAGDTWQRINRGYLSLYFPKSSAVVPEFKQSIFRKTRSANSIRVVCLGGSSMFGTPYQMTANIPALVRTHLRRWYPDREIEVINLAASAINSNVILDFLDEVIALRPDLVLVYMGHNEFYGPNGIGATGLERSIPLIIPLTYRIRELRLFHLFEEFLLPDPPAEQHFGLMKQVSEGNAVSLSSPDARWVLDRFERNLRLLLIELQEAQIPVIASDVASSMFFPPFLSAAAPSELEVGHPDEITEILKRIGKERIRMLTDSLLKHDSTHALAQYWAGRLAFSEGDTKLAHTHLSLARDHDLLKFRAPDPINEIIRRVVPANGGVFISSDSLFGSFGGRGFIPPDTIFWEHLHPTLRGYYEISRLFLQAAFSSSLLPMCIPEYLPFRHDSLIVPWLDLAYADLSVVNITSQWPFHGFHVTPDVISESPKTLREIANRVMRREISWNEGCYRSAAELHRLGAHSQAIITITAILEEFPHDSFAHYRLGHLLKETGRFTPAIGHYRTSIRLDSTHAAPRVELGLLLINEGLHEEAERELIHALMFIPSEESDDLRATAYYGLAGVYANKSQYESALASVKKALQYNSSYEAARDLQRQLLEYIQSVPSQ